VVPDDDALNPYAPPSQEVVSPEVAGGVWRVEGDYLVVQEGTVLPKVDLDGRGMGGPLTPVAMKFPVPLDGKGIGLIAVAALPVAGYMVYQAMRGGRISWLWMMGILIGTQFLFRGVKVRTAPAHVYGYISVPAIRRITRRVRLRRWLTIAMIPPIGGFLPLMAVLPSMRRSDDLYEIAKWGTGVLAISLLILFGVAIWSAIDRGWSCTRLRDGWVWVKGLGPEALAGLGARAVGYQPVPVKKKVFKMRLDLMPPGFWKKAFGTGPLGRFRFWMLRRKTKGGPIEHLSLHWNEREWVPAAKVDPEFLEMWRLEIAGTALADWSPVYAEKFDSTSGFVQVIQLWFLSPDHRHAAAFTTMWVVNNRKFNETRDVSFRSFATDGRIFATAAREAIELVPAEVDFAVVPGKPMEVASAHLQRTSGEALIAMNAEELRHQEERELRLNRQTMEAAGIYGPLEDMDFYRP